MIDSFRTIRAQAKSELKVQRSRFIAQTAPCGSREEAEQFIAAISREYHDATHHCFAYRLFSLGQSDLFAYSDSGEPSGTAGRPIYGAILAAELTNVCVVVTRYFGGIKLGTGGLAHAYRDAARAVLAGCEVIEAHVRKKYRIVFPLNFTSQVLRILSQAGAIVLDSRYSDRGELAYEVRLSAADRLEEAIRSATQGRAGIDEAE